MRFHQANKKIEYENKNQIVKLAFVEDDDDDGGGSPFDDENDLQDLVEDAIYRFPLGDHDTGKFQGSIYIFDGQLSLKNRHQILIDQSYV